MADKKLNLASPWVNYYREIEALLGSDPDINIVYNESENHIDVYVDNPVKADALMQLLPTSREYGNVTITLSVIPANTDNVTDVALFRAAFEGNPALSFIEEINTPATGDIAYIVFKNQVVQYMNDDLSDIHGLRSTLYQDIARDIFSGNAGIFFCTDLPD